MMTIMTHASSSPRHRRPAAQDHATRAERRRAWLDDAAGITLIAHHGAAQILIEDSLEQYEHDLYAPGAEDDQPTLAEITAQLDGALDTVATLLRRVAEGHTRESALQAELMKARAELRAAQRGAVPANAETAGNR